MFEIYLAELYEKLHGMTPSEVIEAYDDYLDDPTDMYQRYCQSDLDCSRMGVGAQQRKLQTGSQQYNQEQEEQEFLDRIHDMRLKPQDYDEVVEIVGSRNQENIDHLINVINGVVSLNGSLSVKDSAEKSGSGKI